MWQSRRRATSCSALRWIVYCQSAMSSPHRSFIAVLIHDRYVFSALQSRQVRFQHTAIMTGTLYMYVFSALQSRQVRVQRTAITTGTFSADCNHDRYIVHVRVQRTAITTSKCSAYYNVQSRQLRNQRTTTTAYTSSWHCNQKFTAIADLGMHYSGYLPRITGRQC